MAKKYIDADRLYAEIEKHIKEVKDAAGKFTPDMGFFDAKLSGIYDVMAIIDSLTSEQPSEDLEEAARHSEMLTYPMPEDGDIEKVMKVQEARIFHEIGFKAGAAWQKEQMLEEMAQSKSPLSVAYTNRCFENGKQAMKEQMLKDAVEGEILLTPYPTIALDDCKDYDFKDGQKVRIIILPKED